MKTFLLGAGCQKGGTSWLFHYLKASPQYVPGFRKEYHVFDALDIPEQAYRRDDVTELAKDALARGREGGPVNAQVLHLASMYANPTFYYEYFSGLLMTRPEARLTADLTPAYGMLPAARMTEIKAGFADRGVRTVSAFLMRDPVDRVLSQLRMQVRRKADRFERPLEEVLLRRHAMPEYALRTAYDHTITALDEAFDPSEVYYGFFEDLFSEPRVRELCDLVGIEFHPPSFDVRRNASPPAVGVSDEVLRTVAHRYRHVYEAVAARFPDVDFEELWPYSRLLT